MRMLMIVYKDSLEDDVRGLLSAHHVVAFTEMHDVSGMGETGPAFHSMSWPGINNMILVALPEAQANELAAALKAYRDGRAQKRGGEKTPLRVFAMPCELLI